MEEEQGMLKCTLHAEKYWFNTSNFHNKAAGKQDLQP